MVIPDYAIKETRHTGIVDDDIINQIVLSNLTRVMSEDLQIITEPVTFNNGLEIVQYPELKSLDLIFMDINMPILNGIEATIKIRNILKDDCPKIVCYSTMDKDYLKSKFNIEESLFDEYLPKPTTDMTVLEKILCRAFKIEESRVMPTRFHQTKSL